MAVHKKMSPVNWAKILLYWVTNAGTATMRRALLPDSYDDDSIVEKIASKRTRVEESSADEGDDEDSKLMVTHTAARSKVQLLQCYLVEQGFSDNTDASHDACADLIYSRAHACFKQTTLDGFFFLRRFSIIACSYNQLMSYWKFAYLDQSLYWAKIPRNQSGPIK